jgi:hypothetical protein
MISINSKLFAIGVLLVLGASAYAQNLAQQANASYQAEEWQAAADAYETLSRDDKGNGQYLYRLGVSQRHLGQFQAAVNSLESARKAGVPGMFVDLELARLFAVREEPVMALEKLELAGEQGFGNVQQVEEDPVLSGLAGSDGFEEAMHTIKRNSAPCEYVDEARDFDFWVGDWEVYDKDGTVKYGENTITRTNSGCYLYEQWVSATGVPGNSMNYYDPGQQRWRQHWVGAGGSIIDIYGGLVDGSMVLEGRLYTINPPVEKPFRGTWTPLPDGRVRQLFEHSDDGGKTWISWFDGYYQRKPESQ